MDLPAPPVPDGVTRFSMSLNGHLVVWADPATKAIHLYDRIARAERPLPGIDVDPDPDGLTVSNNGLVGFDHNTNGLARVYDSATRAFIDTGLPAGSGHRQTHLSGDGRFLATTCMTNCITDPGGDVDAYLQNLVTRQNVPFPDVQNVGRSIRASTATGRSPESTSAIRSTRTSACTTARSPLESESCRCQESTGRRPTSSTACWTPAATTSASWI